MIQVQLIKTPVTENESSIILRNLNNFLDKTKFWGKIELNYTDGKLQGCKIEQSFNLSELKENLSR